MPGIYDDFRIVIVGGGIAGLATAISMRAPGRTITVLEKSKMNKEVGALISLQPNASKIVDRWPIAPFLQTTEPMIDRAFEILDVHGQLQTSIKLDTSKYGADRVCYHRQDLHAAFREAATSNQLLGSPATIRVASPVISCDCEAGTVTLATGETLSADLIVGADGIHSVIRNAITSPTILSALPTGLSAYRLLFSSDLFTSIPAAAAALNPGRPATTMIMAHDRRIIMGPGRGGKLYGLVALVPDENLAESSAGNSWTTSGSGDKLLAAFAAFPEWLREVLAQAASVPGADLALWQLRDTEPLGKWARGCAIVIGDAAHAMLPTQGQGASQSVEDAEALEAFFADVVGRPGRGEVEERLRKVFEARYQRASVIQAYSRQQAKPATDGETTTVRLNPAEFMDFNCRYDGAMDWWLKHRDAERVE